MADLAKMRRRRYRNPVLAAAGLFTAVLLFRFFHSNYPGEPIVILSDAFMVPGMVLLSLALIKTAGYFGSLDLLLYLVYRTGSDGDSEEARKKRARQFPDFCSERRFTRVFPGAYYACGSFLLAVSVCLAAVR